MDMKWLQNRADAASRRSKARIALAALGAAIFIYGMTAYVVLPWAWTHYEHQKGLAGLTMVTQTSQGIPGDPINVGLVGTREDVHCAMHAAGWYARTHDLFHLDKLGASFYEPADR